MGRDSNRGLGIDFTFPLQEGFINNRGETILHEVGLRCICNNEDLHAGQTHHGAHPHRRRRKFGCSVCGGEGYVYRNPRKIVALLTSVSQTRQQIGAGWAEPGDGILSIKPGVLVSGMDKFTFLWPEVVPEGQVLVRGAAQVSDNLTRKTDLDSDEDLLWYSATGAVHCEDEDGVEYDSGSDFILNGSRVIKWVGTKPAARKVYTIKYKAYLEWLAFFPPDIRRDRDRDLGQRVGIRKRHVALVNENPHITAELRQPFCERIPGCGK
jgi:hypothetical protein